MNYLERMLSYANSRDLKRAYNSKKEFLHFQYNTQLKIGNTEISVHIICTSRYVKINEKTHNGFDFCIENDDNFKAEMLKAIKIKNLELSKELSKRKKTV